MRIQNYFLDLQAQKYNTRVHINEQGREVANPYTGQLPSGRTTAPQLNISLSQLQSEMSEFKKEIVVKALKEISDLPELEESKELAQRAQNLPTLAQYSAYSKSEETRGSILNISNGITLHNPTERVFTRTVEVAQEKLHFQAKGIVQSQHEEIEIDLEFTLSRNLMSSKEIEAAFKDPLVINFDSNLANISSEKFSFDIDSDGLEDQISLLGKGSGFLALDKNGNRKIDNGKELFGADNGDGFAALAKYDDDGNGWIDANDEIFNKLRIWIKNDSGEDRLIGLGQVGIGAIYLGDVATDFMIQNSEEVVGELTDTSLFIKENGDVGTIQNINLNVEIAEESPEEEVEEVLYKSMSEEDFALDMSQFQGKSDLINAEYEKQKLEQEKDEKIEADQTQMKQQISLLESKYRQSLDEGEKKKLSSEITILKNQMSAVEAASLG